MPLPQLKALASAGYFFDSRDNNNVDLQQAQCDGALALYTNRITNLFSWLLL